MEAEISKKINAELGAWLDGRLAQMCADDPRINGLPQIVDFVCIIAVEDVADADSDTFYHTVSSGTSHYRKVGLTRTLLRILLNDDDDED